jgi:WD40 repeat protein
VKKFAALLFRSTVFCSTLAGPLCAQTLKPVAKLEAPAALAFALVCDGGQSLLGIAGHHDASLWSLPLGTRSSLAGLSGIIGRSAVACNQKAVALGTDEGNIVIFDALGAERRRIKLEGEVAAVALSADGTLLAAATIYSPVQLWDAGSGKHLWTGTTNFGNSNGIRIAPDGNLILSVDSDTHVRRYDRSGKLLYTADAGPLEPFGVSLAPDGKAFAVAGAEGTIDLHDASTGELLKRSARGGNPIFGLVMASGGKKVIGFELDDYHMHPAGIAYWNADGGELKHIELDAKTLVGLGKGEKSLLLVRQESAGKISIESVE